MRQPLFRILNMTLKCNFHSRKNETRRKETCQIAALAINDVTALHGHKVFFVLLAFFHNVAARSPDVSYAHAVTTYIHWANRCQGVSRRIAI